MKPLFIIANFKSHLTKKEAKDWIEKFSKGYLQNEKIVILCPPFTLLDFFKNFLDQNRLGVKIGAQNISRLPPGAYTGEINAEQIKEFADYVIIGHSERRNFGEDERIIEEKIKISKDYDLKPILCVQGEEGKIYEGADLVAYEPVFAIGTGNPDTPENAERVAKKIKEKNKAEVLYGGSITPENVKLFTSLENINGVLVGTASLNPEDFLNIIKNA
jgi:triosephosphate isomerase